MSQVYEGKKLAGTFLATMQYMWIFFDWFKQQRTLAADPFSLIGGQLLADQIDEEIRVFRDWTQQSGSIVLLKPLREEPGWEIPKVQYHRILDRKQMAEDWLPPLGDWLKYKAPAAALPQFPQIRRRIRDFDGGVRTIRIKS